jgi:hypothetical protein
MSKSIRIFICSIFVICVLAPGFASSADKTMSRSEDPVIVKAGSLSDMKDAQIKNLALFAWDGGFSPIPFQVDERAKNGMFVYTEGEKADPSQGDGKYNGDDELVFMVWDSKGKAEAGAKTPCGPSRVVEIEIVDPIDSKLAWVYLAECGGTPPRSDVDYVRNEYDGTRDWIKTDRYHFAEQRGTSYFDRLALKGASGAITENYCDRIKGRGEIVVAGGFITINTPESELKGTILAWIDGPVRVVHLMVGYIQFSVIKLNLGGQSENLFYPNYYVTPITIDTPVNPGSVLRSFKMRYAIDWTKGFNGMKYYDPVNTKGVVLDGKMSDDEKNMDYNTGHDWYGLTGEQGNLVVRIIMPDEWRDIVPTTLYYVDDVNEDDSPESDKGQRCAGFKMDTMADIKAGKYKYYIYYMAPEKAPPGSVPELMNMIDKPLTVKASKLD